jgi:phage terminase large subunit-like protein
MGELLVDVPGAMWMRDGLDELRRSQAPTSLRIVVAIDLSGTGGEEADECSIVAVGVDADGTGWVLADASGRYQPTKWAKRAIELYHRLHVNCIALPTYGETWWLINLIAR